MHAVGGLATYSEKNGVSLRILRPQTAHFSGVTKTTSKNKLLGCSDEHLIPVSMDADVVVSGQQLEPIDL